MHGEINQSARGRIEEKWGETVSPDLSYLKKRRDVSPHVFKKRDRTLLAHFDMKGFCDC